MFRPKKKYNKIPSSTNKNIITPTTKQFIVWKMIDNICFHNKAGSTQLLYTNVKTTVKKTMNPDLNVNIENGEELKCINLDVYKYSF